MCTFPGAPCRRLFALLSAVVTISATAAVLAPLASAVTPQPVLRSGKAGEFQPAPGDGILAWQENTRKRPNRYTVFARPDGGQRFKVNAKKTNGANGSIEGNSLIYQQYKGRKSNLKFFNLTTKKRREPSKGVNTKHWEYWPSISDDHLLFGRLKRNGGRRIQLFNLEERKSSLLHRTISKKAFLAPGQVNGDYAVWYKCSPKKQCDVFRYHIPSDTREKIANSGAVQRSPSVSPEGTVYLVRSGKGCGNEAELVRQPPELEAPPTVLWQLPSGADVSRTHAHVTSDGGRDLYYEHNTCRDPVASDIYKIEEPGVFDLDVSLAGTGTGAVASDPAGIDCGTDCSGSYEEGTRVTLTATPASDSSFEGWTGACSGARNTCTITMDQIQSVVATFETNPTSITLTVSKIGGGTGTVTSSPGGISCGADCKETYPFGRSVEITATADPGSVFAGWTGDGCSSTSPKCTLTMDANRSVTAEFSSTPLLVVSKEGSGSGVVISDPAGINCGVDCIKNYPAGTSVKLTAAAATGSTFVGWSGACGGTSTTCSVTMDAGKSVTARFTAIKQQLSVFHDGNGTGQVASSPAGINCPSDCSEQYDFGTTVELTASPAPDSDFAGWSGVCSVTAPNCSVTMNSSQSTKATFNLGSSLTVTTDGTGVGTVDSDPAGIVDCGRAGDCQQNYATGTTVTLTATAEEGSTFIGWSGDACDSEPLINQCTIAMNSAKAVNARFDTESAPVTRPQVISLFDYLATRGAQP